jgi:hypothetical protein
MAIADSGAPLLSCPPLCNLTSKKSIKESLGSALHPREVRRREGTTRGAPPPLLSLTIAPSVFFPLAESVPSSRVDIQDTATATSVVATLGRVAVSDKKRGGDIYHMGKGAGSRPLLDESISAPQAGAVEHCFCRDVPRIHAESRLQVVCVPFAVHMPPGLVQESTETDVKGR